MSAINDYLDVLNTFFSSFFKPLNALVWGIPMLVLILGTGLVLMVGLKFMPITKIGAAFKHLFKPNNTSVQGDISPFNALMTSLSATIGTGNIAGVATAIALGGPGALFWMWVTALVGMATKYAEAVLAVKYRQTSETGEYLGGPMYYIRFGLGEKWSWLAALFAGFGIVAGFGIGNTVQSNSVANGLASAYGISPWLVGIVMAVLVAVVILGGIKRIAGVAGKLVPFMSLAYLLAGLLIIALNINALPDAFMLIIKSAFHGHEAITGGFAGAAVMAAIRFGVARGIFSNEAGLGSAPIAHASAKTDSPVEQGMVAMLGTFIDTLIVCSITGLIIVMSGEWTTGNSSSALTSAAFEASLPGVGAHIVVIGLAIFAFTTILGWSVYGERCVSYLLGSWAVLPFRVLWVLAVPIGCVSDLTLIWLLADTFNALMALPNLIALLLLSPVVFGLTREYWQKKSDNA